MNEYLRPYIMRRFVIPGAVLLIAVIGVIIYLVMFPGGSRSPSGAQSTASVPSACVIKGNISEKGERVYHLPGDPWYSKTKLDQSKGERWFCSEAEALAAGWRPPKK